MEAIERCYDRYFCEPNTEAGAAEAASATFEKLCSVQRLSAECQTYQRHESAWNHLVRTPLLSLVFTSTVTDPLLDEIRRPRVRMEPFMAATLAGDSIPFLRDSSGNRNAPACSVSWASFMPSESSAERAPSLSNMKSSGVKVDYVLAL